MGIKEKDLLTMEQLDREQIELILHTAKEMKKYYQRGISKGSYFKGKSIVTLFYEPKYPHSVLLLS